MRARDSQQLQDALAQFAAHIHRTGMQAKPTENYVASPLGAWLLIAQAAGANPAAPGSPERTTLERLLGMKLELAFEISNRLLTVAPRAITVSSQLWYEAGTSSLIPQWTDDLAEYSATKATPHMPTQGEIDAWVREASLGLIETFPVQLTPSMLLVLANVIATEIRWNKSYEVVPGQQAWHVERGLRLKDASARLIEIDQAVYAVHEANGEGMQVISVIAEDPTTPPEDLLRLAEAIATGELHRLHQPRQGSKLYDLRERRSFTDRYTVLLPAWEAESQFSLPGMNYLKPGISSDPTVDIDGFQKTRAVYNAEGFRAAALSSLMPMSMAMPMEPGIAHDYTIHFDHPFAAVATYQGDEGTDSLWYGLPVFSAIVRTAVEAIEPKAEEPEAAEAADIVEELLRLRRIA